MNKSTYVFAWLLESGAVTAGKNILIAAIATLIKGDNVNIFQDQYKNTRLHSMTLDWCVWY